jgi:hypothetical protein
VRIEEDSAHHLSGEGDRRDVVARPGGTLEQQEANRLT